MVSKKSSTRTRILEAAGCLFAERGLRDATIREIVQAAGVNQAAVNYHFRDKDTLYAEVLRLGLELAMPEQNPFGVTAEGASPEERLRGLVEAVVDRHINLDRESWYGRLMAREIHHPSPQFLEIVDEWVQLCFPPVKALVRELNPNLSEDDLWWCTQGVIETAESIAQGHFMLSRFRPEWAELTPAQQRARLSQHIWRFCSAAIRGYAS